jgi:phage head maturation protease
MSKLPTERRTAPVRMLEVETTDNLKYLSAILVPYNEPADIGWFVEDFAPGSLAKSIAEAARGLPLHVFHDDMAYSGAQMTAESWPIGVASEWDDTSSRLRGVWKLDDDPKAQRAAKLATPDEDGNSMLGYMSVRFAPIRSTWVRVDDFNPDLGPEYKDKVTRVEARLVSAALVSTPAYIGATVEWVRSAEPQRNWDGGARQLDEWAKYLEQIKAGPR